MENINPKWMSIGNITPGAEVASSLVELEQRLHDENGWDHPVVSVGAVYSTPFRDQDLLDALPHVPEEEIRAATQANVAGVMTVNLMSDLPEAVQESPHTGLEIMVDLLIKDLFDGEEGLEWFGEMVGRPGFVGLAFVLNSANDKIRSVIFYSRLPGVFLISREGDSEPQAGWMPEWSLEPERDKVFMALIRFNELAHFVRISGELDARLQGQEPKPHETAELN